MSLVASKDLSCSEELSCLRRAELLQGAQLSARSWVVFKELKELSCHTGAELSPRSWVVFNYYYYYYYYYYIRLLHNSCQTTQIYNTKRSKVHLLWEKFKIELFEKLFDWPMRVLVLNKFIDNPIKKNSIIFVWQNIVVELSCLQGAELSPRSWVASKGWDASKELNCLHGVQLPPGVVMLHRQLIYRYLRDIPSFNPFKIQIKKYILSTAWHCHFYDSCVLINLLFFKLLHCSVFFLLWFSLRLMYVFFMLAYMILLLFTKKDQEFTSLASPWSFWHQILYIFAISKL